MQVRDVMQKNVITATPEMSLAQAKLVMRKEGIRHMPVVSGKRLVGIITDRDLRDASPSLATTLTRGEIAYQMDSTAISTCMTHEVVSVPSDMDIADATRLILDRKFGCLPIVDNGTLMGVLTEIDLLRAFAS